MESLVTREMPFGMRKGRIIADLPGNYLNWFARKGFPAGEIGRLLALGNRSQRPGGHSHATQAAIRQFSWRSD
jgi:uncharacterized protein (DUF3820 family)